MDRLRVLVVLDNLVLDVFNLNLERVSVTDILILTKAYKIFEILP